MLAANDMMKFFKRVFLTLLALGVLAVIGLLILAWRAKPLPTTPEALATLSEPERTSVNNVCSLAGIAPESLRHIGGYEGGIFNHALNKHAVVIRNGHVIALCLRGSTFTAVPDLGDLSALEALDLRGSGLTQ